jgi:hypothetical protein
MSMKDIQNGSLYVNNLNGLVVRVRNRANSNSVLATYEDNGAVAAIKASSLRLASGDEVLGFLK